MAPASAPALLPAAAVAPVAMALLLSAAAAAAPPPEPPIGLPGCNTTCGNVSVPYPFGFGPPHCYWHGFNLTCDTSRSNQPPRLLLNGDGSLRVAEIFLWNQTVRVMRTGAIINTTGEIITSDGWNASLELGRGFKDQLQLSAQNDLVISGCNVMATIFADVAGENDTQLVSGSASFCSKSGDSVYFGETTDRRCSGTSGCSASPITFDGGVPVHNGVQARWLYSGNYIVEQKNQPVIVFVAEHGWAENEWEGAFHFQEAPLLLNFRVREGLPPPSQNSSSNCSQDVHRMVCKSDHSDCFVPPSGYVCTCRDGYDGNPFLAGGCQDVDECKFAGEEKVCFGVCVNTIGSFDCQCPEGTNGDPRIKGGCVVTKHSPTGLIIGLSAASGPMFLMVLGIMFLVRKLKQHKIKQLKQKYFKQNRGQLLQQLLSQKADIAERMIIPLDELAKATNNFDRTREIGGGGHGTVYKGILSDLHVVAIKKSKIIMQKEIDEFINEVAILSQINHKNVVRLFGCCLETEVPLLVYEFIPNGTLYHHLHIEEPKRSLSWSNRLRIATEIATSLAYLHSSVSIPIIHRDIKSSNILLYDTMTSKISDFGGSRYNPIENTWLTTRIQGTFGYLDPECFYTGRLTDKSDVYSFGVILVELLTRKKPTCSDLSNGSGGLVPHFVNQLACGNLVQIIDPQVLEEGGKEVQEVAMLAASCINLRGEERPTMRYVELTLEGLQQGSSKKYKKDVMVVETFENVSIGEICSSGTSEGRIFEECSRRYSLEQEMMISADILDSSISSSLAKGIS